MRPDFVDRDLTHRLRVARQRSALVEGAQPLEGAAVAARRAIRPVEDALDPVTQQPMPRSPRTARLA